MDNCNASQFKDMFCNFFPSANKEEVNGIEKAYGGINNQISPAQFQGFMLRFKIKGSVHNRTKSIGTICSNLERDPIAFWGTIDRG